MTKLVKYTASSLRGSPPAPSSSMWNLVTTTISDGATMLAMCGMNSECW